MDPALLKIITECTSAGASVLIVWFFTRHLKSTRRAEIELRTKELSFFQLMHTEHIDERKLSRDAIRENSAMLHKHMVTMEVFTKTLEDFGEKITGIDDRGNPT